MKLRFMTKTGLIGLAILVLTLTGCQHSPKTDIERIDSLRKQLLADAQTLHDIETKDFVKLEKDFRACDSMLQYQSQEQVEQSFESLQLVQAYLEQFKVTKPVMQAEMDSTLIQLDRLKSDAQTHYLSDSLVTVYVDDETEYVNKLSNQVSYFKDRFATCQKDLKALKNKK